MVQLLRSGNIALPPFLRMMTLMQETWMMMMVVRGE
jgi:hypothetical protein